MRTEFRVPCVTGTYADTLTALGLSKLLEALGGQNIRIQHPTNSSDYIVSSSTPIEDVSNTEFQRLFSRIIMKGEKSIAGDIDYDAEKAKRARFFEWRKANPKVKITDLPEGVAPDSPRRDYSLISSLVDLLKPIAGSTYTKTAEILEKNGFGLYAEAALQAFTELGGDADA